MQDKFETYINSISKKFKHIETSEMGYRTDFENLIKAIFEEINVHRIDHDAKVQDGNKPDFVIIKYDIPILYIETKGIGINLDKVEKSEQMGRYFGYANLVLTDYLEFRFYRNGERYEEPIIIGTYESEYRVITSIPDNFGHLAKSLIDFTNKHKEPIRSAEHLAKIMGGKAQRIRDNIKQFLSTDSEKNKEITKIFESIKKQLVHDLTKESFADMYAQTLVYGLFVARYNDDTPDNFTRQEARDLVPESNPFLRHFFDHIVGPDFDKRLEYIVDELCEVFSHADVNLLMKQYFKDDLWGNVHEGPDPVVHFYEDFLREYDAELRKKLGAYYTPLPVVRFIIRSVDYLLVKEFGLSNGLADTSKMHNEMHRVQILDPAVGTGTFLSAVIRNIYLRLQKNKQIGRWPAYVHHDLLPRIHGFEIMMAPYTIAHLKLSMAFKATGFKHFNRRLGIYLTNSLEEPDEIGNLFGGFGFAESIAEESKEASLIKKNTPIMVIIGNPPYSVSSSNKGKWITDLIKDYKKDLKEKNIQPLSDDYIKFLRFAEHYIEKNDSGIVAMITNNTFLDGIIHRQMRKHLLETFDEIYVLDLHGSTIKKETSPDGGKDENVFDIQQGVTITIMIRKEQKKEKLGLVKFAELYGKRGKKFTELSENNLTTLPWQVIDIFKPNYFFVPKYFDQRSKYTAGFAIIDLLSFKTSGIKTHDDKNMVAIESRELETNIKNVGLSFEKTKVFKYSYRPFDNNFIYYDTKLLGRAREKTIFHLKQSNIGLILVAQPQAANLNHFDCVYVTGCLTDTNIFRRGGPSIFPLYLYSKDGAKVPNLKVEIVKEIENITNNVTPEEILDYIYAVLHSPSYREKFKEFLMIDFPRVPYPKDKKTFNELVKLGTELRLLHLLESPEVNKFITTYSVTGPDTVDKLAYMHQNVYINKEQYFGKVPEIAWNFSIGGYQPAQKWLKDRKGRTLTNSEIEHYQKIIVALVETDRIMKEIDKIEFM